MQIPARSLPDSTELGAGCEPEFEHGVTGSGITGLGNWVLTDMRIWDDGLGPALYITGRFDSVNGVPVNNIAKWDGENWSSLGDGVGTPGTSQRAAVMEVFDDGTGEKLYVGGQFSHASNVPDTLGFAKWDGTQWLATAAANSTMNGTVTAMCVGNIANGQRLYVANAGGVNSRIWETDGTYFEPVSNPFTDAIGLYTMEIYDSGNARNLFVGGRFTGISGGVTTYNLVRWNGSEWLTAGGVDQFGQINDLVVHDDGTGPALYVGGLLQQAGGIPVNRIARLKITGTNTLTWSALGSGIGGWGGCSTCTPSVQAMTSFDDGSGQALFVGGNFDLAGGESVTELAKWAGGEWHGIPNSEPTGGHGFLSNMFNGFAVYEECGNLTQDNLPGLFIGGHFTSLSGTPDQYVTLYRACGDGPACDTSGGDYNCDSVINVSDMLFLLGAWGQCSSDCDCIADLNGDGVINVSDLLILLGSWGSV